MMKLRLVKVIKKITNIVIRKLTIVETLFEPTENICGLIYLSCPETMILNLDGKHNKDQLYLEENLVLIFTHETCHAIFRFFNLDPKNGFDHRKIIRSVPRSNFLVDGDWKWLEHDWTWSEGKWVRKKTSC